MNECEVRAKFMDLPKSMAGRSPEDRDLPKIGCSCRGTHARNATALLGVCRKIDENDSGRFALGNVSPRRPELYRSESA